MDRREVLGLAAAGALAVVAGGTAEAQTIAPFGNDRNNNPLQVGSFVNVPCIVKAIAPSLNPLLTTVTLQTLPNLGTWEYEEGLEINVYAQHTIRV